jgi:hypothetical protein
MQTHDAKQKKVPKEPESARSSPSSSEGSPSPDDGPHDAAGAKVPVRDFREDGWYRIENELLDPEHFPELDPYDIAVYNALAYHVSREEDGCFPSRQTIADHARCSHGKVWDCVQKLCELGLIRKTERATEDGRQTSHEYHLLSVKNVVRRNSGEVSQHDRGGCHDMTGEVSQHDDEQQPSKKTQKNNPTTATSARAGGDFGEGESGDSAQSGPGLTDRLKEHFSWLDEVGDEDKKQAVYRVADRLLTDYSPSSLRDASVRAVCVRVIEAGYGEGVLDEMTDLQRESVLDTLTALYEEGWWSQAGHEWTEPVTAVAVARFRDLDLSRVGGIVKGWKKGSRRQDSAGGSGSRSPINGSGEVGGDSSRQGMPRPPGNKSGPPTTWETDERGFPADLQATKEWAEAHDFSELLARGLWVACGKYGWTDHNTRSSARLSDGDSIRNLESYARAHDTQLMAIANQHDRGHGPHLPD